MLFEKNRDKNPSDSSLSRRPSMFCSTIIHETSRKFKFCAIFFLSLCSVSPACAFSLLTLCGLLGWFTRFFVFGFFFFYVTRVRGAKHSIRYTTSTALMHSRHATVIIGTRDWILSPCSPFRLPVSTLYHSCISLDLPLHYRTTVLNRRA